ncbi:hypothetical protein J2Z44_001310 [Clostridium punense]|uniref:PD-(D/E)XK nuclease family protein n=1 Tax=Clostridium punense TaxID=1054297 RepID=A0ABS4K4F6_9CLOT|nr:MULTISPECIES: PD-(D/E)XK nuclease family protein [Clostridium]EQB89736.1 hypothetical protein M918_19240 [Clostridium sp. BL8]MBP2021514.1 hypothetical protein [Clostridium punense]
MGVFERIYKLVKNSPNNPREDYLTEIFGEVIKDKGILSEFIEKFLCIDNIDINSFKVDTQRTYEKLDHHETDSRPDLVIEFYDSVGKGKYVVFVESKLGAKEGCKQLERYREHLLNLTNNGIQAHFIYLTALYDPKEDEKALSSLTGINFFQYRWYEIYNWLKKFKDDRLNQCLIEYMEELGMDKERIFLPQDIYLIQNLDRIISMVEETMSDKVQEVLSKFGKISQANRLNQLLSDGIYRKFVSIGNDLEVSVDLYLTDKIYPMVSTSLWVSEKYENLDKVRNLMKSYVDKNIDFNLDLETWEGWIGLCIDKSLLTFLSEEDHVKAIQDFYIKGLENIKNFMDVNLNCK